MHLLTGIRVASSRIGKDPENREASENYAITKLAELPNRRNY